GPGVGRRRGARGAPPGRVDRRARAGPRRRAPRTHARRALRGRRPRGADRVDRHRRDRVGAVERAAAVALLARLHAAQGDFYAGGDDAPLRALLDPAIEWHVPGRNAIAGDYRGVEEVIAYFARRRDHAARTFRMHPGDLLAGEGDRVAVLTDGTATI